MCNKNLSNPWGLREPAFKDVFGWEGCCSCFFRGRKISDIQHTPKSAGTPVLAITLPPEPQEKTKVEEEREEVRLNEAEAPPRSSGSESSGYFTPPPEGEAFVKLDGDDPGVLGEVLDEVDKVPDCVESFVVQEEDEKRSEQDLEGTTTLSETSDPEKPEQAPPPRTLSRISLQNLEENKILYSKSKSITDLQTFLPEIPQSSRKSSAPLSSDPSASINFQDFEILESVVTMPELPGALEESKDEVKSRLPRRFTRSLSRKSIRTPRTPQSQQKSRPQSKPKEVVEEILGELDNGDWEVSMRGLQGLVRLIREEPEVVENHMHAVCGRLAKHVKNLRSQVSRSACNAAAELFKNCRKNLDMEFEEVAVMLLQRTADTNKFLRADANSALDSMAQHLPLSRVVAVVTSRGTTHQNALVRAASTRILNDLVMRNGPDRILLLNKETKDKLLVAAANAVTDGNLDARRYGRSIFSNLITHHKFNCCLTEAVPQHILRHISKILHSLKP